MTSTATSPPTRMIDGVEAPVVGRWSIDPGHTEVAFVGRHLVFTKVRGRFRCVQGFVEVATDPNKSTVEVSIDMASVDSGDATRDDHLQSADLFDVERFPVATFRGRALGWRNETGRWSGELAGDLTIKGDPRPVQLRVAYLGAVADPWGGERASFSASGTVNREDWGMVWNMPLASGGLLVSNEIRIELELETVRQR